MQNSALIDCIIYNIIIFPFSEIYFSFLFSGISFRQCCIWLVWQNSPIPDSSYYIFIGRMYDYNYIIVITIHHQLLSINIMRDIKFH